MNVTCGHCQKSISTTGTVAGRRLTCPECGGSISIPVQEETNVVSADEVWVGGGNDDELEVMEDDEVENQASSRRSSKPDQSKICPMCGAKTAIKARKCSNCGETLAGVQGVDGRAIDSIWRQDNQLVMRKDAQLPAICVKTNQPATSWLRRKLSWHSPGYYLLILISLLIYIIVALIIRKTADIKIGLSRPIVVRRRWAIAGGWLGGLLGIGLFIAGVSQNPSGSPGLVILAIIVGLGSIITGLFMSRMVVATKITNEYVWLKGIHPEYLNAFPEFPGEG